MMTRACNASSIILKLICDHHRRVRTSHCRSLNARGRIVLQDVSGLFHLFSLSKDVADSVVFCSFDLHHGHMGFLQQSKDCGEKLSASTCLIGLPLRMKLTFGLRSEAQVVASFSGLHFGGPMLNETPYFDFTGCS